MSTIDRLASQSESWTAGFTAGATPGRPASGTTIVTCMDARIDTYALLGLDLGEAHVLRNAGGVVTQDVLRSLTISQRLLGTREVMVVQHTRCGMMTFTEDGLRADLERDTGARPTWLAEAFTDLDASVAQSVERVRADPFVPHRDAVRGFVYDVEGGSLREVAGAGEQRRRAEVLDDARPGARAAERVVTAR